MDQGKLVCTKISLQPVRDIIEHRFEPALLLCGSQSFNLGYYFILDSSFKGKDFHAQCTQMPAGKF